MNLMKHGWNKVLKEALKHSSSTKKDSGSTVMLSDVGSLHSSVARELFHDDHSDYLFRQLEVSRLKYNSSMLSADRKALSEDDLLGASKNVIVDGYQSETRNKVVVLVWLPAATRNDETSKKEQQEHQRTVAFAINGFDTSLPVAVCSGLVNTSSVRRCCIDDHVVSSKLPTVNGFDLSLPRAVCSWTSQLFTHRVRWNMESENHPVLVTWQPSMDLIYTPEPYPYGESTLSWLLTMVMGMTTKEALQGRCPALALACCEVLAAHTFIS
nr:hypothetical protein [Tanacetum cinerariifolium]